MAGFLYIEAMAVELLPREACEPKLAETVPGSNRSMRDKLLLNFSGARFFFWVAAVRSLLVAISLLSSSHDHVNKDGRCLDRQPPAKSREIV